MVQKALAGELGTYLNCIYCTDPHPGYQLGLGWYSSVTDESVRVELLSAFQHSLKYARNGASGARIDWVRDLSPFYRSETSKRVRSVMAWTFAESNCASAIPALEEILQFEVEQSIRIEIEKSLLALREREDPLPGDTRARNGNGK
ncbi:MAG: hypothetical protein HYY93_12715 [Planctomycetes bacterium]|nr:hypothetical protein [Planctomycetota bacterium]